MVAYVPQCTEVGWMKSFELAPVGAFCYIPRPS